jgi:hypothetical protein
MTTSDTPQKLRKAPIFTPYVLLWSTLGALSFGLLMVLGLAPEWLEDLKPSSIMADPQSNQGQRATARLAADVNSLKQSVAQVQLDLTQVKTDVAAHGEQQRMVSAQLTSIEKQLSTGSAQAVTEAPAAPVPPPTGQRQAAAKDDTIRGYVTNPAEGSPITAPPATAIEPPQTASSANAPKMINADAASAATSLETGSVSGATMAATQPISFGPAVVKPAPKPLGVKLSTAPSLDSLRLSWSLLAEKHGDTLKSMEARYVTSGDPNNPAYDLVAGPVKSKAEANKVCKALQAQGTPCKVGAFTGEQL